MPSAEGPASPGVPRRVLGQYVRELRQQAGLTVKQAARLMEWSEPKLWRIETGSDEDQQRFASAWRMIRSGKPACSPRLHAVRAG